MNHRIKILLINFVLNFSFILNGCGGSETIKQTNIQAKKYLEGKKMAELLENTPQPYKRCEMLLDYIKKASRLLNIEEALIAGVIMVESSFKPYAVSKQGAIGLMQILPSSGKYHECGDLYDPLENIMCGTKILKRFIEYYDGNLLLGLSGYNAGHYYADQAKKLSHVPANFNYVEKVLIMRAKFLDHHCRM